MQILGESVIHELVERRDNSNGRIWKYRFVTYKSGTALFPTYTVYLYHNGVLESCATSAHSFFMAALIVRDYHNGSTIDVFPINQKTKKRETSQLDMNDI